MPLKRAASRMEHSRHLLQDGGQQVPAQGDGDGAPTKVLIGVLVPVGVLLIALALVMYKYSRGFRQSADSGTSKDEQKEVCSSPASSYVDSLRPRRVLLQLLAGTDGRRDRGCARMKRFRRRWGSTTRRGR